MTLSIIALLLSLIAIIISLGYHVVLFLVAYLKGIPSKFKSRIHHSTNSINVLGRVLTIILPIKNEPIDLVVSSLENKVEVLKDLRHGEVVVISDDSFEYIEELVMASSNIIAISTVIMVKRLRSDGGRSAALDTGARLAKGEAVMILDVDSRIDGKTLRNVMSKFSMSPEDVIVVPWRAYSYITNRLSEALIYSTNVMSFFYYKLRALLGLFIFPLGCGTVIPLKVLNSINFWGWGIIQDDIWLGTKLAHQGITPKVLDCGYVYVLVPSKLTSLRIQQSRWAYGTSEVLSRSFTKILSAPIPSIIKLEMIMYMLQPAYSIPMTLSLGLAIIAAFEERGYDLLAAIVGNTTLTSLVFLAGIIIAIYIMSQLWMGMYVTRSSLRNALVQLGRNAALLGVLTPILAVYSLLGLVRRGIPYKITPKGHHEKILGRDITLYILAVPLFVGVTAAILNSNYVALMILLPFVITEVYALIRVP